MGHLQAPPSPPRGFFGPGAAPAAIAQKTAEALILTPPSHISVLFISINVKFVPKGSEPNLDP